MNLPECPATLGFRSSFLTHVLHSSRFTGDFAHRRPRCHRASGAGRESSTGTVVPPAAALSVAAPLTSAPDPVSTDESGVTSGVGAGTAKLTIDEHRAIANVHAVDGPAFEHQRIRIDAPLAAGEHADQGDLAAAGERAD